MTVREDEAVAVDVVRVGRVAIEEAGYIQVVSTRRSLLLPPKKREARPRVFERLTEKEVGDGGHAHRRTRVARVGLSMQQCIPYRGTSRGGGEEKRIAR